MRDSEVDDDWTTIGHEHVAGLEISMHDTGRMNGLEGIHEITRCPVQRLAVRRTAALDPCVERAAADQPRGEVRTGALNIGSDQWSDTRVLDECEDIDLPFESGSRLRVVGDVVPQDLDRKPASAFIEAAVDNTHPAFAELLDQAIWPDTPVRWARLDRSGRHDVLPTPHMSLRKRVQPTVRRAPEQFLYVSWTH